MTAALKLSPSCELVCDSHADRGAWLKARMTGIGSSESHDVVTGKLLKLYTRKTGILPALEQTERMDWGQRLEALVGEVYGEKTGRRAVPDGRLYRSTEHRWALTTLDWLTEIEGEESSLEIKCVGSEWAHEWEDGPPKRHWWQCQTQMLVKGTKHASIIAFIGGNRFAWTDIERDDDALAHYVKEGSALWDRIERRDPPPPDASDSARLALAAMYPCDTGTEVMLPGVFLDHDADLREAKDQRKNAEKRILALENLIKDAIGDATKGWLPDGTGYSWKQQSVGEHTVKATKFRVLRRHASKER